MNETHLTGHGTLVRVGTKLQSPVNLSPQPVNCQPAGEPTASGISRVCKLPANIITSKPNQAHLLGNIVQNKADNYQIRLVTYALVCQVLVMLPRGVATNTAIHRFHPSTQSIFKQVFNRIRE